MSRITNDIAKQVATKLLEKKKEAQLAAAKKYQQFLEDEAFKQVPKEIMDLLEKHNRFFNKVSAVKLIGHGFEHETVKMSKSIPSSDYNYFILEMTASLATKIMNLKRASDKAKEDYDKSFQILEQALINCRTFKNVEQNIPEAKPYLPQAKTMALAINYADVRKLIA